MSLSVRLVTISRLVERDPGPRSAWRLLANTAVIMDQADHCCVGLLSSDDLAPAGFAPDDPTALKCLRAINKGDWALFLRVRRADLLLAFPPLSFGVRSTLQAGQRYALLWLALLEVLRRIRCQQYTGGVLSSQRVSSSGCQPAPNPPHLGKRASSAFLDAREAASKQSVRVVWRALRRLAGRTKDGSHGPNISLDCSCTLRR
jgi:hypothetical protein